MSNDVPEGVEVDKGKPLTIKQDNFCIKYVETGNASEAYRMAYDADSMNVNTVNRCAKELLDNPKITTRVNGLRRHHQDEHCVTVGVLLTELEEARQAALGAENPQSSAAVAATMGKAKILGLDKQVIDHTSSDGSMSPPKVERTIVDPKNDTTDTYS